MSCWDNKLTGNLYNTCNTTLPISKNKVENHPPIHLCLFKSESVTFLLAPLVGYQDIPKPVETHNLTSWSGSALGFHWSSPKHLSLKGIPTWRLNHFSWLLSVWRSSPQNTCGLVGQTPMLPQDRSESREPVEVSSTGDMSSCSGQPKHKDGKISTTNILFYLYFVCYSNYMLIWVWDVQNQAVRQRWGGGETKQSKNSRAHPSAHRLHLYSLSMTKHPQR